MKLKRSSQKKASTVSPANKAAQALPGQAPKEGIRDKVASYESAVGLWLRGRQAMVLVAMACALLACRANRWGWNYGVLTYNGQAHANLLAYDARNHVNAINAAAAALKEGNLMIREVPWFNFVAPPVFHRYPFFQFYGLGAYFIPALLVCAGLQAFHAFLIAGWLSFVAGFVGMFRVGRILGLRVVASMAGAAVFTLAPYHLTDWYGRTAFTETLGLALLPWALYGLLKSSREPGIRGILLSTGIWSWLMITHTVLHILAAIFFFGFLAIDWAWRDKKDLYALLRPGIAYVFGCLCAACVLWPVARFGEQFGVTVAFYPQDWAWVSNLRTLFSPTYYSDSRIDGFIGLQIGWPLVLAWLGSLWLIRRRPWIAVFAGLLGLCVFIAWSPVDIWKYLGPLKIVQFPYRVLSIIITFAAVLAAASWDGLGKRFEGLAFLALILVLTLVSSGYIYHGGPGETAEELSSTYGREGFLFEGRRYPYTIDNPDSPFMQANYPSKTYSLAGLSYSASVAGGSIEVDAALPLTLSAAVDYGVWTTVSLADLKSGSVVQLPAAWYPSMYAMRVNGKDADYGRVANRLAVMVPEDGDLHVQYRFRGMISANLVSYFSWLVFFALLGWSLFVPGLALPGLALSQKVPQEKKRSKPRARK